jgi:hypothetical protein
MLDHLSGLQQQQLPFVICQDFPRAVQPLKADQVQAAALGSV